MKWRWAFLAPLVAACFAACGGSSKPTGSGGGGGGDGGSGGGPAATGGGGSGGASLSKPEAGIPGCAQKFIDADGVCRPVIEKCPAGTIPKFDTGCIPVGIAACDGSFLEADGICHPSIGKCPDGTFAVPSEGCVSIDGDGCGTDAFGLASDQAGDQFVDPSNASGTPDGSRANPWPSIAEGLAHVAAGGRVRLAAGAYAEPLVPASAVAVIGRCASMVTLSGTVGSGEAAAIVLIEDVSGDVSLQGMTLSGDGYGVVVVGGTVDLDGVVVDGAMTAGIEVGHGGTGTFHHVLVRGTRPAPDQTLGTGLDAFGGGTATVEQSAVVGAYTWGIDAVDVGSRVTVSDSLVEGIQVQASDDAAGYGVIASYGGAAKVDDVAVVAVAGPGLATYDATSLTATHTLVDKVSGPHSHGIDLERSTTVNGGNDFFGSGLAVLGTDGTGAGVYTLAKATITASLFAHGRPNVQPTAESFFVTRGGSLILSDTAMVDNAGTGMLIDGSGTNAAATGILVEHAFRPPGLELDSGEGLFVQFGASASFSHAAVFGSQVEGLAALDGTLTFGDSIVSGPVPLQGIGGECVNLYASKATVKSALLEKCAAAGLTSLATTADVSDVVVDGVVTGTLDVRDSATSPIPGLGDGVLAARGQDATTKLDHVWITGAARAGVLFANTAGAIDATHVEQDTFGLVTQGSPTPTVGADDELSGTEEDRLENGTLAAP